MTLAEAAAAVRNRLAGPPGTVKVDIPLGATTVKVSGRVDADTTVLKLVNDPAATGAVQFADLADFLGLEHSSFPDAVLNAAGVTVGELALQFALEGSALLSASGKLTLPDLPGAIPSLTITGNTLDVAIDHPLDAGQRSVQCSMNGTATIGSKQFALSAALPDFVLKGSLAAGQTVDILAVSNEMLAPSGLALPSKLPQFQLTAISATADLRAKTLGLACESSFNWAIDIGGKTLNVAVRKLDMSLAAGSPVSLTGSLTGALNFAGATVDVSIDLAETASITAAIGDLSITAIAGELLPNSVTLPAGLPSFTFSSTLTVSPSTGEFSLVTSPSTASWRIPVGIQGIDIRNVTFTVRRSTNPAGAKTVSSTLEGTFQIGGASFSAAISLPGDLVLTASVPSLRLSPFIQDLAGADAVRELPPSLLNADLTDLALSVSVADPQVIASGTSPLGQAAVVVKRNDGKWQFTTVFAPPDTMKFSAIDQNLVTLDSLHFAGTSLVATSAADPAFLLPGPEPRKSVDIVRGLNIFANLNAQGTGMDDLLGIQSIGVKAAIGVRPQDLSLEAALAGDMKLADGIIFGGLVFKLRPKPFSVELDGKLTAIFDSNKLEFIGGMQVSVAPPSASLKATMLGDWKEPFGAKGVVVSNLALDLGVSFPPVRPSFGLAGSLKIGTFEGQAAVKVDTAVPSRSLLLVAFNRLFLTDVIGAFCGPTVLAGIPDAVKNTVLNVGFEGVEVRIVPQATSIGEIQFEQGITVKADKIVFFGLTASGLVKVDFETGVVVKADMDPIDVGGGLFKLSGVAGRPKPSVDIEVAPGKIPFIDIQGSITLLGVTSETQIKLSESGFFFLTDLKLFDLFECSLQVSGKDLQNGGDYFVKAAMKNDLIAFLREHAVAAIKQASDDAQSSIAEKQREVADAQAAVNGLDAQINAARAQVTQERAAATAELQRLQNQLASDEAAIANSDAEIERQRNIVRNERSGFNAQVAAARKTLSGAQAAVNSKNDAINVTYAAINIVQAQLNQLYADIDQGNFFSNIPRWAQVGVLEAQKTALYGTIEAIKAERQVEIGFLEAAKAVLSGLLSSAQALPVDADPRVVAAFAARGLTVAALEVTRQALGLAQRAVDITPIDLDPRVSGLIIEQQTATVALQAAQGVLELGKQTVGGVLDVAAAIVTLGLGGILDIKEARFEAFLGAASSGSVSMFLKLEFMQKPQELFFSFNFKSPLESAKELAKMLVSQTTALAQAQHA